MRPRRAYGAPALVLLLVVALAVGAEAQKGKAGRKGVSGNKGGPTNKQGPKKKAAPKKNAPGPKKAEPKKAGPKKAGPKKAGPGKTGPKQAGPKKAGPEKTGPKKKPAPKKPAQKQKSAPKGKPAGTVRRAEISKRFVLTLAPNASVQNIRARVRELRVGGRAAGCAVRRHYPALRMLSVRCATTATPKAVLQLNAQLRRVPGVRRSTPDAVLTAAPSRSSARDAADARGPDTPMFLPRPAARLRAADGLAPYNWGLDRLDEDRSPLDNFPVDFSCYPRQGAGVKVFVIDTGCMVDHDEFSDATITSIPAPDSDFYNGADDNGHGTHIAGIVAGKNVGVARNAQVVCIKSFDKFGNGAATDTISAVEYVIEEKEKDRSVPFIVNLSYSALTGFSTTALDEIVFAASSRGIVFAVSAGNAAVNACLFSPSKAEQALTITASTKRDTLEVDSNIGPCVELIAPGHQIVSAGIESRYDYASLNGTSMATPHVVGLSALVLAENRQLQDNPRTVRDNLYEMLVSQRSVDVATFIMPLMETGCGSNQTAKSSGISKRSNQGRNEAPVISPVATAMPSRTPWPSSSASPSPFPSPSPSLSPTPSTTPRPKYRPEDKEYWDHRHAWEMEEDLGGGGVPPSSAPDQFYQYGFGPHVNPYEDASTE